MQSLIHQPLVLVGHLWRCGWDVLPRKFRLLPCIAGARAECYGSRLGPANLINLDDVISSPLKGVHESLQLITSHIATKRHWSRYARGLSCCLCVTLQRELQGRQLNGCPRHCWNRRRFNIHPLIHLRTNTIVVRLRWHRFNRRKESGCGIENRSKRRGAE